MRLAILLVVILSAPAGFVSADDGASPGWRVLRFTGEGPVKAEITGTIEKDGLLAVSWHRPDGSLIYRLVSLQVDPKLGARAGVQQVRAGTEFPPLDLISSHPPIGTSLTFHPTGEDYLVFIAAGDVSDWHVTLTNITVVAETSGVGAYYSDGSDFAGGAAISVEAPLIRAGAFAQRSMPLEFEGVPYLEVIPPAATAGVQETSLTLTGPNGTTAACPCKLNDLAGTGAAVAGLYRVDLTGIRAEAVAADAILWGADLRTP